MADLGAVFECIDDTQQIITSSIVTPPVTNLDAIYMGSFDKGYDRGVAGVSEHSDIAAASQNATTIYTWG